jgi:riboflavin synthase alpha subunit
VAVVPHTLRMTNLSERRPSDRVNVEVDVLGKYVERLLEARLAGGGAGEAAKESADERLRRLLASTP